MKIYFSNYRYHWYSPYKIIEKAMFWKKDFDAYENEPPKWLTNICVGIRSVLDFVHPQYSYSIEIRLGVIDEICKWCINAYGNDFSRWRMFASVLEFEHEKDYNWFILRWS